MNFFISVNGEQRQGPFSKSDLEKKMLTNEINNSTLVWTRGMDDWAPLDSVKELDELRDVVPPPLKKKTEPIQIVSTNKPESPAKSEKESGDPSRATVQQAIDDKYFLDGAQHYFRNTFQLNNEFLSSWDFLVGIITRVMPFGFILETLVLQQATYGILSFWTLTVLRGKRARAVRGQSFKNRIVSLDIFFFLTTLAVILLGGDSNEVSPFVGPLSGVLMISGLVYGLWSTFALTRDSVSLDKGGSYCMLQYLKPNTLSKKKALIELLENIEGLVEDAEIPNYVAVSVNVVPSGKTDVAEKEYGNRYYFLCCYSDSAVLGIKDWASLSSGAQSKVFRKKGQYADIDRTLLHLKRTVGALKPVGS